MITDVLCDIGRSMCRMMTPFASEDTLHFAKVSGNMFGGIPGSIKFFHSAEDEALLLLKSNFLWGDPADFKFFDEKKQKTWKIALSLRLDQWKCSMIVTTMLYTSVDSPGLREHLKKLSGVYLIPLTGYN